MAIGSFLATRALLVPFPSPIIQWEFQPQAGLETWPARLSALCSVFTSREKANKPYDRLNMQPQAPHLADIGKYGGLPPGPLHRRGMFVTVVDGVKYRSYLVVACLYDV